MKLTFSQSSDSSVRVKDGRIILVERVDYITVDDVDVARLIEQLTGGDVPWYVATKCELKDVLNALVAEHGVESIENLLPERGTPYGEA